MAGERQRRVAVMQPYFLPYLGYWQLLRAVEVFVVYDTAQYSKGGWINRNRYMHEGRVRWLTVPVARGSLAERIGERRLAPDFPARRDAILRRVEEAYRGAPFRDSGMALLEGCLRVESDSLLELLLRSLRRVADHLGIATELRLASEIEHDESAPPVARVLDLCAAIGASDYHNLGGGRALYAPRDFADRGVRLWFPRPPAPSRWSERERADHTLSILDLVMRNDPAETERLLDAAAWEEAREVAGSAPPAR